jgi:alpha-beta hydrolase superfamily lysophospholipase
MPPFTDHVAPEGLRTRGTVIVVPGRGENPTTYQRLGARLAADAYRVRVLPPPPVGDDLSGTLDQLAARLAEAVDSLSAAEVLVRPLVLVAADTGASAVAALVSQARYGEPWWPDAVVLAGLPGSGGSTASTWEAELDERTSCVVHRRRLTEDPAVQRGALARPVPRSLLDAGYAATADLPQLFLIGDADRLADHDALAQVVRGLPRARLSVVRGAHHDVLNDLQHRSVAAEVVSFLETLRNELVPVIAVESSTW